MENQRPSETNLKGSIDLLSHSKVVPGASVQPIGKGVRLCLVVAWKIENERLSSTCFPVTTMLTRSYAASNLMASHSGVAVANEAYCQL